VDAVGCFERNVIKGDAEVYGLGKSGSTGFLSMNELLPTIKKLREYTMPA
jgi:hypothetical protein